MKVHFNNFKSSIKKKSESLSHILLHGSNQSEIKEMCNEAALFLCGPSGHEEMRISRLPENTLLKDPDRLQTIIKTISFFPGKQVLIVEGATDKISKILATALNDWTVQDAIMILASGAIKSTSSLRKMVESNPTSICTSVYDEQRSIEKIEEIITLAQVKITNKNVTSFLINPRNFSSMQSFILFMEKLEAYKFSDQTPVTFEDINLLLTDEQNLEEFQMLEYLASGDVENMINLLRRLFASGIKPNKILNSTSRYFVLLHKLSLSPSNPDLVLNKNYPPLFGNKRNQIIKNSKVWSTLMIEHALDLIAQLEKKMRSSSHIELNSLLERSFLRIISFIRPIN